MSVQSDVDHEAAPEPGGPRWDEVLTPSDLCAGVFDVRWDLRPRLRRWLSGQDLPVASGRETHRPAIDAWALLDGGVIAVSTVTPPGSTPRGSGPASVPPPVAAAPDLSPTLVPPGMRVIGFRTLRLLSARLGLGVPETVLRGERMDPPGLVEDLFDRRRHDAEAVEQAELLATGTDRSSLRWVVTALRS